MLVLDRHVRTEVQAPQPSDPLQTIAVGLGAVQLLLDVGQVREARKTLRAIRGELQSLRRSV